MSARLTGIVISLIVLAGPAAAETWRPSSGADGARAYIDTDSIRREGDRVSFRREIRWPAAQALNNGMRYDRIAELYDGDCRAMTLRSMSIEARLGERVVIAEDDPGEVETAQAGSTAEADLRAVCRGDWPAE